MLQSLFRAHGEFCASHPLEIVVTIVTIIMSLMSMGGTVNFHHDKVCGWNYQCAKEQMLKGSDVVVVSIGRCISLVYIYLQFRSLRRLGSKHLLGISGIFTIFSSFVFCIAFVKLFGNTLSGLHEALPYFLFLVDLSKVGALAVFALSSTSREDIQKNIGRGMELLGPALTLDTLVETLAIGLGTLSGVQQLEIMSRFGCLSFVANYVAFITFYPACLALVLELSLNMNAIRTTNDYEVLAKELREEHECKKTNPVLQRIKAIMCVGLAIVHIHKRFITPQLETESVDLAEEFDKYQPPETSLWYFYLHRLFAVHVDRGMTLMLGIVLLVKYVFWDRHTDLLDVQHSIHRQMSYNTTASETQTDNTLYIEQEEDIRTSFSIGDDSDDEDAVAMDTRHTQTDQSIAGLSPLKRLQSRSEPRSLDECVRILKTDNGPAELTDAEIKLLVEKRHIPPYKLEGTLGDHERGVSIRRQLLLDRLSSADAIDNLPFSGYDYTFVDGACCENVIGYMPVPVGVAGPLLLDGKEFMVPMATTEGCLVASTNRGCRALSQGTGVRSCVVGDGMSRAPCVRFPSAVRASQVKKWLEVQDNYATVKQSFDATSRFARLKKLHISQAGRMLYIRCVAKTGDAMGMNMVSKGTEKVLHKLQEHFTDMEIISLSGNFCTDKKPSAINWVEGRGKSVICEALVPAHVVRNTLKTSVADLVSLGISKNLVGSAMAGSIGGFNAHAANIVTAIFIATGQDAAQCVVSANCITLMEAAGDEGADLYITCTMPTIEVGTIGGGTILPPQAACLKMLGVKGPHQDIPGENAEQLARIVCGTVLAGELSLMSALAAGHLVHSHLRHNRSSISIGSPHSESSPAVCGYPSQPPHSMPSIRSCLDQRLRDVCVTAGNQAPVAMGTSLRKRSTHCDRDKHATVSKCDKTGVLSDAEKSVTLEDSDTPDSPSRSGVRREGAQGDRVHGTVSSRMSETARCISHVS